MTRLITDLRRSPVADGAPLASSWLRVAAHRLAIDFGVSFRCPALGIDTLGQVPDLVESVLVLIDAETLRDGCEGGGLRRVADALNEGQQLAAPDRRLTLRVVAVGACGTSSATPLGREAERSPPSHPESLEGLLHRDAQHLLVPPRKLLVVEWIGMDMPASAAGAGLGWVAALFACAQLAASDPATEQLLGHAADVKTGADGGRVRVLERPFMGTADLYGLQLQLLAWQRQLRQLADALACVAVEDLRPQSPDAKPVGVLPVAETVEGGGGALCHAPLVPLVGSPMRRDPIGRPWYANAELNGTELRDRSDRRTRDLERQNRDGEVAIARRLALGLPPRPALDDAVAREARAAAWQRDLARLLEPVAPHGDALPGPAFWEHVQRLLSEILARDLTRATLWRALAVFAVAVGLSVLPGVVGITPPSTAQMLVVGAIALVMIGSAAALAIWLWRRRVEKVYRRTREDIDAKVSRTVLAREQRLGARREQYAALVAAARSEAEAAALRERRERLQAIASHLRQRVDGVVESLAPLCPRGDTVPDNGPVVETDAVRLAVLADGLRTAPDIAELANRVAKLPPLRVAVRPAGLRSAKHAAVPAP